MACKGAWNFVPLDILAPCAYLASLLANKEAVLKLRPNALERLEGQIKATIELIQKTIPSAKLPEMSPTTKQRDLVRACKQAKYDQLLEEADTRARALLRAQEPI